jgi:SAM-dependent methyltransferase
MRLEMFLRYKNSRALYIPTNFDWWWNDCFLIRRHLWAAIREEVIGLNGDILDFGCGSKPYRELFEGKKYVGIDIAQSGHDHTDSQIDVWYNGHRLNFADASFDVVFSTEVLEHLFNYDEILPELRRVLRPNGKLFITTPFLWPEHEKPYDYARYTSFGLKALLEKHGFEQVSVQRRGHAVEALCQMALIYATEKLVPRVPILRRLTGFFWCSYFNLLAMVGSKLLPSCTDIYLSNIAKAVKSGNEERVTA